MLEKKHMKVLRNNFPLFCKTCMKIRTKSGEIKPLVLNLAQLHFYEKYKEQLDSTGKTRLIVLKGRQQGLSTIIEALYFHKIIFNRGLRCFILTHEAEATKNLFNMVQRS